MESPTDIRDIRDLEPLSAAEIVNGSYEALKAVMATMVAQLISQDPMAARQVATQVANQVDDARVQFILELRKAEDESNDVEAEVVEE
jgi:hypothetical protein